MIVISVVQQKGGVGKTTLAINLAGELRARGKIVTVVDSDPQASALAWSAPRKLGFEVLAELITGRSSAQWLRNVLKQQVDIVVIDTPAGLGAEFRAAVDVADLVVVPCGPSSLDLNAARKTLTQIATILRGDARSQARVITVPVRIDAQLPEGQQIASELQALGEAVAPAISHDVYFVRAFSQGVSVSAAAAGSAAASEVKRLVDHLLDRMEKPR